MQIIELELEILKKKKAKHLENKKSEDLYSPHLQRRVDAGEINFVLLKEF